MKARDIVAAFAMALGSAAAHAQCTPEWYAGFSSQDLGNISATFVFNDGAGPAVFALADLNGSGDPRLLRWNGSLWEQLTAPGLRPTITTSDVFVIAPDGAGPAASAIFLPGTYAPGEATPRVIHVGDGREWSVFGAPFDTGSRSTARAVAVYDDDGPGPNPPAVFATGNFQFAAGVALHGVAKWSGSSWRPLGDGLTFDLSTSDTGGRAMTVFDPDGTGPARPVLVVAGEFTAAGGLPARNIAAWDGSAWSPLAAGVVGEVRALTVFDFDADGPAAPELVAGGNLSASPAAIGVARWNGSRWAAIGSGIAGAVYRLEVIDTDVDGPRKPRLIAAGHFAVGIGVGPRHLAQWTGESWTSICPGLTPPVGGLAVFDADGAGPGAPALITGELAFAGSGSTHVNFWDGDNYVAATNGVARERVTAITLFDSDGAGPARPQTIIAGRFWSAGMIACSGIVAWDGERWSPLGAGIAGDGSIEVNSMAVFDDDGPGPNRPALFVAGKFNSAGGQAATNIAKWDGAAWSPLAQGLGGSPAAEVKALAVFDDDGAGPAPPYLYAGGQFQPPGGSATQHGLARWNGQEWSAPSAVVEGHPWYLADIDAMTVFDADGPGPAQPMLCVGGSIISFAGTSFPSYKLLGWDSLAWSRVGVDGPSSVSTLAVHDADGPGPGLPDLIAGGAFTSLGTRSARYLARWDSAEWSPVGPAHDLGPLSGAPTALAVHDADGPGPAAPILMVVGPVTGTPSTGLASWNGAAWDRDPLGAGRTPGPLTAASLADAGPGRPPALYLGGEMLSVAGVSSERIARHGCAITDPCRCDLSVDGVVDFGDYLVFLNLFDSQDPAVDFNADGIVDVLDYLEFLNLYDAGC